MLAVEVAAFSGIRFQIEEFPLPIVGLIAVLRFPPVRFDLIAPAGRVDEHPLPFPDRELAGSAVMDLRRPFRVAGGTLPEEARKTGAVFGSGRNRFTQ